MILQKNVDFSFTRPRQNQLEKLVKNIENPDTVSNILKKKLYMFMFHLFKKLSEKNIVFIIMLNLLKKANLLYKRANNLC